MPISPDDLRELRETFRARMREEDFCIGEGEVEKLFRELLGEPEPPRPTLDPTLKPYTGGISCADIDQVIKRAFDRRAEDFVKRDSPLLEYLRKR